MTQKKIVIFICIFFAIAVIIAAIIGISRSLEEQGKVEVPVHTIPDDAVVLINDQIVRSGSKIYLKAGDYQYEVSRDGFVSESRKITITDSSSSPSLIVQLQAETEAANEWLKNNQKKVREFESFAGNAAVNKGIAVKNKNPIVKELPISNMLFKIGYKNDPADPSEETVIVTIRATEQYRQDAINYLIKKGYDLSIYKFEFYDMEDPFNEN